MPRQIRVWGKKRGQRRTGSNVLGSVGEATFFGILFLIGAISLIAFVGSRILQQEPAPSSTNAWGFWPFFLVSMSLLLIGAGGVVRSVVRVGVSAERRSALAARAQNIDILSESLPSVPDFPTIPRDKDLTNSPGITLAYRLPMAQSPAWKLAASGLFCVFWNGFVAVIIILAVQSHLAGQTNWFLSFFSIPFAVVGFQSVFWFLRLLVLTTGIGPTSVEVSHQPFYPGRKYQIFVTQLGRLAVKSLTVSLVCEEEAIYRQGTDVRTENRRVYQQQILRREDFEIAPGLPFQTECQFELPGFVMHSFQANHNAIKWRFLVHGVTRRWPTFEREFPVVVYPPSRTIRAD